MPRCEYLIGLAFSKITIQFSEISTTGLSAPAFRLGFPIVRSEIFLLSGAMANCAYDAERSSSQACETAHKICHDGTTDCIKVVHSFDIMPRSGACRA